MACAMPSMLLWRVLPICWPMPPSRSRLPPLSAGAMPMLRRVELVVLLGALTTFTPFAVDMYMPALPTIGREFHAPIAEIEHSLAAYFLGLTLGQAAVG